MRACVFCDIAWGRAPARIVSQDALCVAFFPLDLGVRGHTVLAPTTHVAEWADLRSDQVAQLFTRAQELSTQICSALKADAVNILLAGGPAAQQSIAHFHLHILPRWRGDGVDAWPALPGYAGDLDADLYTIRTS